MSERVHICEVCVHTVLFHGLSERWTNIEDDSRKNVLVAREEEESSVWRVFCVVILVDDRWNIPFLESVPEQTKGWYYLPRLLLH